jgi:hypothetical protein
MRIFLFGLFLICTLLSCVHKSGPAPKLASDQFDSMQVEEMNWRDSTKIDTSKQRF